MAMVAFGDEAMAGQGRGRGRGRGGGGRRPAAPRTIRGNSCLLLSVLKLPYLLHVNSWFDFYFRL